MTGESSETSSPLKQQMRLFENPASPMKGVKLENLESEKVKELDVQEEREEQ